MGAVNLTPEQRQLLVRDAEERYGLRTAKPITPPRKERGDGGGRVAAGKREFGNESDVNLAWRPPKRWETVHAMRTHPDTTAAMDTIIRSLLSVDLQIEPAVDPAIGKPSDQDEAIAAALWDDLNNMSTSLGDFRREALDTALWYGCAAYQIVYHDYDWHTQRWPLKKFAFRPPWAITAWPTDDFGGPAGIVYLTSKGKQIEYSMDELVVFVSRRRGGDLSGEPLSRRLYGPWYVLDKLYRIAPAGAFRQSMGVPVMTTPNGGPVEEARIEELLEGLSADVYSYVRLAQGQTIGDFEIKGISGGRIDPVPLLEYFRKAVYLATFTQGQVLGSDQVGSYALADTQMSMLMVMLREFGSMELDTLNRYFIPKYVDTNWPGVERYPQFRAPTPDTRNVAEFFTAVLQAGQAGIPLDREAIRIRAHELLGMPLPADAPATPTPTPTATTTIQGHARQLATPTELRSQVRLRELGIVPNWHRMASRLDGAESRMLEAVRSVSGQQIGNLVNRARDIFRRGDASMVADTEVQFRDEMQSQVLSALEDLYDAGSAEALEELERQGVRVQPVPGSRRSSDRGLLDAIARQVASAQADRLQRAFAQEVLGQLRDGRSDPDRVRSTLEGLSDSPVRGQVRTASSSAFGMGRLAGSEANANSISHYINSEVLDSNTCEPCIDIDGIDVAVADARNYAPYHLCDGRDRCRGELVPVTVRGDKLPPVKGDAIPV